MGLSEHALQYHMSDWSSCAIWDPYVARDPNPTRMEVSGEKNGFGTKNPVSAFKVANATRICHWVLDRLGFGLRSHAEPLSYPASPPVSTGSS